MTLSRRNFAFFLTALIIGCSFLQGVNTDESAEIIRQARIGAVFLIYFILLTALTATSGLGVQAKNSLPVVFQSLYLVVSAISLLGHPEWAFGTWKLVEFLMYVLWAVVVSLLLRSRSFEVSYFGLNLILTVVAAGVLFSIVVTPSLAWNQLVSILPFQLRGGVLPLNSNDLAMILLVGIMYLHLAKPNIQFRQVITWSLFGLLLATQNRTALTYFAVFALFNFRTGWLIGLGGIAGALLSPAALVTLQNIVSRGDISNILTGNGRTIIWGGVINQMSDSLLLGQGFYVGHRFASIGVGHFFIEHTNTFDNTFLDIAFDTGVVGLVLFLGFLLAVALRIYRNPPDMKPSPYLTFLRWLTPFFLIDALTGPTVQTFGVTLAIYVIAFLPAFSSDSRMFRPASPPTPMAVPTQKEVKFST